MTKEEIKNLLEAFSWKDLGEQKMSFMMSFVKDEYRMNIYMTTMSITIQRMGDKIRVYRDVDSLEKLEKCLN